MPQLIEKPKKEKFAFPGLTDRHKLTNPENNKKQNDAPGPSTVASTARNESVRNVKSVHSDNSKKKMNLSKKIY